MPARTILRRMAPFAAYAAFVAVVLPAQVQWQRFEFLPRTSGPIAYDNARDRFVHLAAPNGFGVSETWERDRSAGWSRRTTAHAPPWRDGRAMVHDMARGVTVLFSGFATFTSGSAETYLWDGTDWTNVSPLSQPPPRSGHAMAYDIARSRAVLFGGLGATGLLADTWEWNGSAWIQQALTGPPARNSHALAYDPVRGNVVLFGGRGALGTLSDTWTYAAGAWTQRPGGPGPRLAAAMAFDFARARTVLFGGASVWNSPLDETWEWDGTAWSAMTPAARPPARQRAGLASDPVGGGVVLVGGSDSAGVFADTWRWDGTAWTLLGDQPQPQPQPRQSHASAFDEARGELLVFGGINYSLLLGDLWRWNGTQWSEATTAGPAPRSRGAMAFDTLRGEAVMFGGELPGCTNETWVWNGTVWAQPTPAASPLQRFSHAMAYDLQRGRVVLFGGRNAVASALADTWEWDGTNWLPRTGAGPPGREGHAMSHDLRRGVTVLYGGRGASPASTVFADTWEWNGSTWTQRLSGNNPGPRLMFGMAFDTARERTVVFGDFFSQDTWEWDGSNWMLRAVTGMPQARARTSLAYDSWREHVLLFGGEDIALYYSDLWHYGSVTHATVTRFGSACAGSIGLPHLHAPSRPWLGDPVSVVLGNVPNTALAAIWAGLSKTAYGAIALPLPLAAFGMPGCSLFTSIDAFVLTAATASGTAVMAFAVPNQPALLGVELHFQGAFLDPPANPIGIAMAGALTLRIGGR